MPNDARLPPPGGWNFANLLHGAAEQFGQRPALVHRGKATSFAALQSRAAAISDSLRDSGVSEGDVCAIHLREPEDAAAAFFGTLAVGATAINVNELLRPRQIEYILGNAGCRLLLTSRDLASSLPRPIVSDAAALFIDDVPASSVRFDPVARAAGDRAQITYTSGSTGLAKGVAMSNANLWAGVRVVAGYLGLTAADRIAGLLPFSFVYGFNQLTTALYTGATLVVERSTLVQEVVATLRREQVTVLAAVPPLWQQLLATAGFRDEPLPGLRIMTNAGGRLSPASVVALRAAQPQAQLFLMYGLTEVFRSTFLPPDEVDAHPDSMGRAVPESTVYVVTESGAEAAPGEVGELVHGGPTVGLGYVGDPEATARVFRANPFGNSNVGAPERVVYSGDLVRRDDEGRLYYVGRRDRMIKTLGFRVSPDEVCDVVLASGLVADAAIVAEPDVTRGSSITACVVLKAGASLEQLRRFCGIELPRYMQPSRYALLDAIPRNPSGKHDIPTLQRQVAGATAAPPSGAAK